MYQNFSEVETNDPFRPQISLCMIEASSLRWWQPEDGHMKRFALVVAALYLLTLVVLTAPVIKLAFGVPLAEAAKSYLQWPFWLWGLAMVAGQLTLLSVPVRVANRRPVTRRSLLLPILTTGLLVGGLMMGAIFSIYEFIFRGAGMDRWVGWATLALACISWGLWTLVFYRMSRSELATDIVSRLCRWLLKGSMLELLIAVPTHIVARYREYCCAGIMTFIGLTMGISVMLFSFGPAVFFLFLERWRRLHPASVAPSETNQP
jgi:hypothetical protein